MNWANIQRSVTVHVIAHIYPPKSDKVLLRPWKGGSLKAIKRKARERYAAEFPGARVSFGRSWHTHSYGGH